MWKKIRKGDDVFVDHVTSRALYFLRNSRRGISCHSTPVLPNIFPRRTSSKNPWNNFSCLEEVKKKVHSALRLHRYRQSLEKRKKKKHRDISRNKWVFPPTAVFLKRLCIYSTIPCWTPKDARNPGWETPLCTARILRKFEQRLTQAVLSLFQLCKISTCHHVFCIFAKKSTWRAASYFERSNFSLIDSTEKYSASYLLTYLLHGAESFLRS